jgi:hypothetical protein
MLLKAPPALPVKATQVVSFSLHPLLTGIHGVASASTLGALFFFFLKAGAFVFGSGLAIVPFLYGGLVVKFHWLTERQFVDAVAVAMITPGPVVITAGFVGYLVAGVLGALAAALAVFAPPVFISALWGTVLPSVRPESSGQSVRTGSNSGCRWGDCRCGLHTGAPLFDRRIHCTDRNPYISSPDEHEEGSGTPRHSCGRHSWSFPARKCGMKIASAAHALTTSLIVLATFASIASSRLYSQVRWNYRPDSDLFFIYTTGQRLASLLMATLR